MSSPSAIAKISMSVANCCSNYVCHSLSAPTTDPPLERHSRSSLKEGHYMIYLYSNSGSISSTVTYVDAFCSRQPASEFSLCLAATCFCRTQAAEPFSIADLHAFSRRHTISCKSPFLQLSCDYNLANSEYRHSHCCAHERQV